MSIKIKINKLILKEKSIHNMYIKCIFMEIGFDGNLHLRFFFYKPILMEKFFDQNQEFDTLNEKRY